MPDRCNYCHTLYRITPRGFQAPENVAQGDVQVWTRPDGSAPRYRRLFKCGNVWTCPVCSGKIAQKRGEEIAAALEKHQGGALLVTLTFRHKRGEQLSNLLTTFLASVRRFKQGATYTKIKKEIGYVGAIRALEITYGENGFHPHTHELIFTRDLSDEEIQNIKARYCARWIDVLQKFGLSGAYAVACDVRRATDGEYLVKYGKSATWNAGAELARGDVKETAGRSMWELLEHSDKDKRAAALYREFYKAIRGKKILFWSPGLKKKYLIPEVSDEDLANDAGDPCILAGTLTPQEYGEILHRWGFRGLGRFLFLVERLGFERARENLHSPP